MSNEPGRSAHFRTTHWSRVIAAGGAVDADAGAALAELCAAYWLPLYAYVHRNGNGPEQALDLTQEYFARLLERGTVAAADPTRRGAASGRSCSPTASTSCAASARSCPLTPMHPPAPPSPRSCA